MGEGATEAVEQVVAPGATPTGAPERKSWWDRLKALWWVSGFSSAFALVHLLDGLAFPANGFDFSMPFLQDGNS